MDRWRDKTAVVTGASSGIGAAVSVALVKSGMIVVALARREDRLMELKNSLPKELQERFHTFVCDVTNEGALKEIFQWVKENLNGIHVLINNAGIGKFFNLVDTNNTPGVKAAVDTNIMGVVYCVREAFQQMAEMKIDGHVVIINSLWGHKVPRSGDYSMNIYSATKHAVTAMTETYRQEFSHLGTNVKVTVSF